MKHLFIIHSHTVFLTSLGIIEKQHLKDEDIVFVYGRNYSQNVFELSYPVYDLSDMYEDSKSMILSISRKTLINYKKLRRITQSIDKFIEDKVKGEFEVYLPHLSSPFFQLFATSRYCNYCHFVQEGGRVMVKVLCDEDPLIIKLYNYVFLKNNERVWRTNKWLIHNYHDYLNCDVNAFVVNESFFGNLPITINKVGWPVAENLSVEIDTQCPIFVFDGYVEQGAINQEEYLSAIKKMVNEDAKNKNYLKFHPNQIKDNREKIIDFFKEKGIDVIVMSNDIPFELILTKYKKLQIYGYGSSLLIFAKAFGHLVKARESDLLESKQYRRYFERNIGPINDSLILR